VDPYWWLGAGFSVYNFATNAPLVLIDPSGGKEKPYEKGKSKPITKVPNTDTPIWKKDANGKDLIGVYCENSIKGYNCHSYAWHNSGADTNDENDSNNANQEENAPRWDNSPSDDIAEQKALQLRNDVRNKEGDRVIYYQDEDGNGAWSENEPIAHSAIVDKVDADGNTTEVRGKMGYGPISYNHPGAPGYYPGDNNGNKFTRAYFRVSGNYQNLGNIRFDSDTAIPVMKSDGKTIDYLIVQDLNTGKDYGVNRNENGSYSWHQSEENTQDSGSQTKKK
jgi:hypothetical protein